MVFTAKCVKKKKVSLFSSALTSLASFRPFCAFERVVGLEIGVDDLTNNISQFFLTGS